MQRVFIGIPVDDTSQRQINELLHPYQRAGQGISWVPGKNRHMTLAFLGDRHAREIEKLSLSIHSAYEGIKCFSTGSASLTRFPNPAGNIIALEFEACVSLARLFRVTQELVRKSGLDQDLKPFRPHITVARLRNENRLEAIFGQSTDISLQVDRITLYRSTLTQGRRVYHGLEESELC